MLAGACTGVQVNTSNETKLGGVSVVRVQLEKLLPQLGCNLLQAGEVQFANLALVGVAQLAILSCRRRSQVAMAENVSKSRMRSFERSNDFRKSATRLDEKEPSTAAFTALKVSGSDTVSTGC